MEFSPLLPSNMLILLPKPQRMFPLYCWWHIAVLTKRGLPSCMNWQPFFFGLCIQLTATSTLYTKMQWWTSLLYLVPPFNTLFSKLGVGCDVCGVQQWTCRVIIFPGSGRCLEFCGWLWPWSLRVSLWFGSVVYWGGTGSPWHTTQVFMFASCG